MNRKSQIAADYKTLFTECFNTYIETENLIQSIEFFQKITTVKEKKLFPTCKECNRSVRNLYPSLRTHGAQHSCKKGQNQMPTSLFGMQGRKHDIFYVNVSYRHASSFV